MASMFFFSRNRTLKKAEGFIDQRRFDDAQQLLLPLHEKAPKDVGIMLNLAVIAFEKGDKDKAEAIVDQALAQQPDNPVLHLAKGEVLHGKKSHEESLKSLMYALELSPDNPKSCYLVGLNYIALGRTEEAIPYFEKLVREEKEFVMARLLTIAEVWWHKRH